MKWLIQEAHKERWWPCLDKVQKILHVPLASGLLICFKSQLKVENRKTNYAHSWMIYCTLKFHMYIHSPLFKYQTKLFPLSKSLLIIICKNRIHKSFLWWSDFDTLKGSKNAMTEIFLIFLLQSFTVTLTSNSTAISWAASLFWVFPEYFLSFYINNSSLFFYIYILSICKMFHYIVQLQ